MIRNKSMLTAVLSVFLGFGAGSVSYAATAATACGEITAACRAAGFVQGAAKTGNGLQVDCIAPIMQGRPQPRKGDTALPRVDPQVVAACKTENPTFGRRTGSPAAGTSAPVAPLQPAANVQNAPSQAISTSNHPNIVFILTDDLAWNLVQYMPHVLKMQKEGVTFNNYFVTDSLCCPSRSSIFTGRYPHDTGVFRNTGNDGGYLVFRSRGHENATFANALSAGGYRTAMLGKYLNGYLPPKHGVPPGWTSWSVAGNGYPEFNYNINQNGKVVHYGNKSADYLTDILSGLATGFIKQSAGTPFVIEIATFAPHAPYTPAPRDADAFPVCERRARRPLTRRLTLMHPTGWSDTGRCLLPIWPISTGIFASARNRYSPSTR